MTWLARLKPLAAVAAVLVVATAGFAVQGRQQPAADGAPDQAKTAPPPKARAGAAAAPEIAANQAIARKQLALIDQARDAMHKLYQNARASYSSFDVWDRRKLEALRRTGAGKAEMIAALEKHLESLKQEEAIAKQRHEGARGTFVEVLDAQYRILEAEIWLNEEKAK